MDISTLGIDLSKTTFHAIGFNAAGEIVLRRKFSRTQLLHFTSNRQPMLIGMEACGGAHFLGGKTRLLGISKLGNEYLRRMFLHGARSVVAQIGRNPSPLGLWLANLSARSHRNVAVVALANKMARTAWAILSKGTRYCTPAMAAA